MIKTKAFAIALLALGAAACGRRTVDTAPSETNTTSGTMDRDNTAGTTTTTGAASDTSGANAVTPYDNPAPAAGAPGSLGTTGYQGGDVSGTTTITADEPVIAADKKDAGATITKKSAQGTDKANTSNTSSAKGKQGDNKSTPLGDGTSGEYTGGKGTYGGKATHGTGTPTK